MVVRRKWETRRSETIYMRVTISERLEIERRTHENGMTISAYFRKCGLSRVTRTPMDTLMINDLQAVTAEVRSAFSDPGRPREELMRIIDKAVMTIQRIGPSKFFK